MRFQCCFRAEIWVFVMGYSVSYLYTDKDDVVVQIWHIYRSIGERERDLGTLRSEIQADQGVCHALARFGVLKFVENPLMRAGEPLLA